MSDKAKLPAWLREAAHEIENAHRILDDLGAPDAADDGIPISLALRILVLFDQQAAPKQDEDEAEA